MNRGEMLAVATSPFLSEERNRARKQIEALPYGGEILVKEIRK